FSYPALPNLDAPPEVAVWTSDTLAEAWAPPACTGWKAGATNLVVAVAGHFSSGPNADAMLARLAKISLLADIRYWSVTDKTWDTLFLRATSLRGPDQNAPREDFTSAELRAGQPLFFLTIDNRSQRE